jgi:hypothetical protein
VGMLSASPERLTSDIFVLTVSLAGLVLYRQRLWASLTLRELTLVDGVHLRSKAGVISKPGRSHLLSPPLRRLCLALERHGVDTQSRNGAVIIMLEQPTRFLGLCRRYWHYSRWRDYQYITIHDLKQPTLRNG